MTKLEAMRFETDDPQATPLVLAHGLFGQARNFGGLARRFAETRPAIAVDLRNHGDSPWDDAMDYPAMGGDLLRTIAAEADGRAVLLGHSMGGKAAMAAALSAPERVAGLIVADIAPVAYDDHDHAPLARAMRAVDLGGVTRRSEVEAQLSEAAPEAALRAFLMQNLAFETIEGERRARWRPNLAAIERAMPALLGWPDALADARYDGPTLVIHGGASDYVGQAADAPIAALFPAAERVVLDGAGHWLHAEQPEAFVDAVEAWLERNGF